MPKKKELEVTIYCPKCGEGQQMAEGRVGILKEGYDPGWGCYECHESSPFSEWCPENISIPGAIGKEDKPTQKAKILDMLLHGVWIDRLETIERRICWELSARIGEIEKEWGVSVIRNWIIKDGRLRCRCYRLKWSDIESIQDTLKNMRHNKNMENKLENE